MAAGAEVFDILVKIGVADEITRVLTEVSESLVKIAEQASTATASLEGMAAASGKLGAALLAGPSGRLILS